jgi:hypothetical protein
MYAHSVLVLPHPCTGEIRILEYHRLSYSLLKQPLGQSSVIGEAVVDPPMTWVTPLRCRTVCRLSRFNWISGWHYRIGDNASTRSPRRVPSSGMSIGVVLLRRSALAVDFRRKKLLWPRCVTVRCFRALGNGSSATRAAMAACLVAKCAAILMACPNGLGSQ